MLITPVFTVHAIILGAVTAVNVPMAIPERIVTKVTCHGWFITMATAILFECFDQHNVAMATTCMISVSLIFRKKITRTNKNAIF